MKDYHKILGIKKGASPEEIKSAYKKLAKKYYPDVNQDPEAESKFKDAGEAYEALKNGTPKDPWENRPFDTSYFDNFKTNFVVRRSFTPDLETVAKLEFMDACFGIEKRIEYHYKDKCDTCEDYLIKNGSYKLKSCLKCGGSGKSHITLGHMSITQTCDVCIGSGKQIDCDICGGKCYQDKTKAIQIKFPEAIDDEKILRVMGAGNYNFSTKSYGNLFIKIEIENHSEFKRKGRDVFSEISVDFLTCILGGTVQINTIHGLRDVDIRPYTQDGSSMAINDLGVGSGGRHFVVIRLKMPKSMDSTEIKILESLKNYKEKRENRI
jgi:molecular chaperone DnaJ